MPIVTKRGIEAPQGYARVDEYGEVTWHPNIKRATEMCLTKARQLAKKVGGEVLP